MFGGTTSIDKMQIGLQQNLSQPYYQFIAKGAYKEEDILCHPQPSSLCHEARMA